MYHGLSVYNKCNTSNVEALLDRIAYIKDNQACFADIRLGGIGIFIDPDNAELDAGIHTRIFFE